MKEQRIIKPIHLLWMVLVVALALFGACQKEDMDGEGTVSLSSIPENREYANLPLIGTKWQLIGFANTKTGRIKLTEKTAWECDECFTMKFYKPGEPVYIHDALEAIDPKGG